MVELSLGERVGLSRIGNASSALQNSISNLALTLFALIMSSRYQYWGRDRLLLEICVGRFNPDTATLNDYHYNL